MDASTTALLLIGFQNDYFAADGALHGALEDSEQVSRAAAASTQLITDLYDSEATIIETPIRFTADYSELVEPIGILQVIMENSAFSADSYGAQTIDEIAQFGDRVITLTGKRGLNCFSNTDVAKVLKANNIKDVIIAGAVTSLCVDTAGREAADLGYRVHILRDCTAARTAFEHKYYSDEIMPLYAHVCDSSDILQQLNLDSGLKRVS